MTTSVGATLFAKSAIERIQVLDWERVSHDLGTHGNAVLERVLSPHECRALAEFYSEDALFRSHVIMARHGFGRGEYKYFNYPLPEIIAELRPQLYSRLAPIANHWNAAMGINVRYPEAHADFIQRCHAAGQLRPTPLLLQYAEGDYNCLHQDLYGEHVFPIQVAILLSEPSKDFTGGELPNSVRACNHGQKLSRYAKAMPWLLQCTIARCRASGAAIG